MSIALLEFRQEHSNIMFLPDPVEPSATPDIGRYSFDQQMRLLRRPPVQGTLAETVLSIENDTLRFRNRQVGQRVDEVLSLVQSSPLAGAHTTLVFTQPRPFKLPILLRLRAERTEQRTVAATLTIVDLERRHHLPETLLQLTFGLTRAEATLASALAGGETLQEIAERTNVRMPTLRTQLANVLAKTGTARQPQLICLLSKIAMLTGEDW